MAAESGENDRLSIIQSIRKIATRWEPLLGLVGRPFPQCTKEVLLATKGRKPAPCAPLAQPARAANVGIQAIHCLSEASLIAPDSREHDGKSKDRDVFRPSLGRTRFCGLFARKKCVAPAGAKPNVAISEATQVYRSITTCCTHKKARHKAGLLPREGAATN